MIRITTLIENSQGEHLALNIEHGISFCIETEGHKILFDTGQSDRFIQNAAKLRIDLTDISHVVLSHGHYDHSGGFRHLTEIAHNFELVTGPGFFNEKYGYENGRYEYLGNDFTGEFIKEKKIRYSVLEGNTRELVPGVFVLGGFPRIHGDEKINPRFMISTDTGFINDSFADEVMVVVDSPEGLIAILGCSHPGMKNMLDEAMKRLGKPLYAVIGGTHMVEATDESVNESVGYLKVQKLSALGVSHCTGKKAMNLLGGAVSSYFSNRTGSSLIVL